MQPGSSTSLQFKQEKENRYPDCLYVDIATELELVTVPGEAAIYLTINFNEQWLELPAGRVRFGLRGGELRFTLKNGQIPYSDRALTQELLLTIQKEIQIKRSSEQQGTGEGTVSKEGLGAKLSLGAKATEEVNQKIDVVACQVSTKGSEENPVWDFRLKGLDEPVLKGLLDAVQLASMKVLGMPCELKTTFEVSLRDVWITDAEGLYPPDINSNKLAWIKREIVFWLLRAKLQPYLSRIILQVGATQAGGN